MLPPGLPDEQTFSLVQGPGRIISAVAMFAGFSGFLGWTALTGAPGGIVLGGVEVLPPVGVEALLLLMAFGCGILAIAVLLRLLHGDYAEQRIVLGHTMLTATKFAMFKNDVIMPYADITRIFTYAARGMKVLRIESAREHIEVGAVQFANSWELDFLHEELVLAVGDVDPAGVPLFRKGWEA